MSDAALQTELVTSRLRLRPLRRADAGLLHLYLSDPKVARMTTSIPHPYPPGVAENYIERVRSNRTAETVWALDTGDDDGNGLVGVIGLKPRGDGTGEIAYWVAPAFWGTGYAGEAVEAVKAWAADIGLRALIAEVYQDNVAAARVLTRAGFAYTGDAEAHSVARGAMAPTFRYRLDLAATEAAR